MTRLFFALFAFFIGHSFLLLSAQTGCPEDRVVVLPEGNSVMVNLLDPDVLGCLPDSSLFTISGATNTSGILKDNEVLLNLGDNEVDYFNCATFQAKVLESSSLLPDGTGVEYAIPFVLSNYPEGSTVGEVNQPIFICATMEHSYLGDLDIWVECPDSTKWLLHEFDPNDNVRRQLLGLGEESTETPDSAYQYCWRVGAAYTFEEYINTFNVGNNQTLPAGDYAPEDPLSVIMGCEINGEWTLRFRDNIARDNGSVAAWSVGFTRPGMVACGYNIKVQREPVSIGAYTDLPGLSLAVTPNPFGNELVISTEAQKTEEADLMVYTVSGREVFRRSVSLPVGEQNLSFDASGWPVGIYFLRVRTEAGELVRKIVRR